MLRPGWQGTPAYVWRVEDALQEQVENSNDNDGKQLTESSNDNDGKQLTESSNDNDGKQLTESNGVTDVREQ